MIRPVDMQIMMPRMTDLSAIHQAEKEKPILEQLQMTNQQDKQVQKDAQIILKAPKHSKMQNEADAKEKGKNPYTYHPTKKNHSQVAKENEKTMSGGHLLDIKI